MLIRHFVGVMKTIFLVEELVFWKKKQQQQLLESKPSVISRWVLLCVL